MDGGGPERPDPQVARAMRTATELLAAEDGSQPIPALLAYSNGSVTANGALGSVAAMLRIGSDDVFAIVRLASADTALSSGRSEWTGSCVSATSKSPTPSQTGRGASAATGSATTTGTSRRLPWRLANDRQMAGLGSTTVLHQRGHPEKRKRAEQFDTHEVYNSKADALTHQLDDAMPL